MKKIINVFTFLFVIGALALMASCGDVETKEPTKDPTLVETPTKDETPTEPTQGETTTPTPEPSNIEYSVVVTDIAGKPLADFYVTFYLGNEDVAEGFTNTYGKFTAELEPNNYEVIVEETEGYYLNTTEYVTDLIGTPIEVVSEIDDLAGVEADPKVNRYELGDIMYDFTVVDTEGNSLTLYDLLEDYKLVVLNFWYTTCSACYYEFPYLEEAYSSSYNQTTNYSDDVAIIAINPGIAGNGDTLSDITSFKESMGLTFNVAMDYDYDTKNLTMDPALTTMFGVTAYPTTIFIDSYGLIAEVGVGAVTATDKWTQTFDKYLVDDYVPVYTGTAEGDEGGFIKPDITQADSSELEAAINGNGFVASYSPEDNDDAEYSWPWIVTEYKGKTCIRPSNEDINPSFAIVYTTINMKKGDVFAFDYYSSTEEYDSLYVTVNGSIATSISGQSPDWEKSYAYVALKDGEYEIGFCYLKDNSYSNGEDAVFITNLRIVTESDIDKETYIFRECATGTINEFTMRYTDYAEVFYNENDGYYHVDSVDGPLLLADMLSGTQWNNSSLYEVCIEGGCIGADGKDYNSIIEKYSVYASNSIVGYTPVTQELADALKQVVKALGDDVAADNLDQWLEVCVYYSAYGTNGVELGVPTVGVCPFEPIMFEGNGIDEPAKAEANFNRIILPRGFIFGFTPEKSGVYSFYSTEEALETVGWICDANGDAVAETEYGLRLFAAQTTNGLTVDNNFIAYVYLEAGKTYLYRAAFYDIYEYSVITVEMKYEAETMELLTVASPGYFTSSDDEMSDIISGNYVDFELGEDGYYHVKDSLASDDLVYCDILYINNITGYSLKDCLERFNSFDFSKDEFGNTIFDENGYYRYSGYDENDQLIQYFVCQDQEGNLYYVTEVGADGYTEENGYTYIKFTNEELVNISGADTSEYVAQYISDNMITDPESELYGCVKVDEQFAYVLGMLMDKYTFADVAYSWAKLCYYYKYVGPVTE